MIHDLKAILCDMDGTLFSTYRSNFLAYQFAAKEYGLKLTDQEFRSTWGRDAREFLPELYPDLELETFDEIRKLKAMKYPDFIGETSLNTALLSFLFAIRKQVDMGLVTTAKRANVDLLLSHYQLTEFFDVVISGDEVRIGKPSPEGYLLAMKQLSAESALCLAIEDTEIGAQAAQSAGISCLRIESYEPK